MHSVSKPQATKDAVSYYTSLQESYYRQDGGKWDGGLVAELCLTDTDDKQAFALLLDGYDPRYKDKLVKLVASAGSKPVNMIGKNGKKIKKNGHRSGIDETFSVDKSITLMSHIDPDVLTDFEESVKDTVKYIEQNFAYTQTKRKGRVVAEKTDKLLYYKAMHGETRPYDDVVDPQLHCHCYLFNVTKNKAGKYKTVLNDPIYKNQKHIGCVFNATLAKRLNRRGYKTNMTDKGQVKIAGIDEKYTVLFSGRSKAVDDKYEEFKLLRDVKKDKRYIGLSDAELKDKAALESRGYKKSVTVVEIQERIITELAKQGTSLEELHESAKTYINPISDNRTAQEIILAAVDRLTMTQSTFTKEELISAAIKEDKQTKNTVENLWLEFLNLQKSEIMLKLGERRSKAGTCEIYTSKELLETEKAVIDACIEGKGRSNLHVRDEYLEYFESMIKSYDSGLIEKNGYGFTPGQIETLKHIVTTRDQFSIIQGDAGTGKSFACKYARGFLIHGSNLPGELKYHVRGLAPTGKASTGLATAAHIEECSTIDKFLLQYHGAKELGRNFCKDNEIWLVDEAGMIGSRKFKALIDIAKEVNAKVVFIGDRKQFQSVEAGRMFAEIQDKTGVQQTKMEDVIRQRTAETKELVKTISAAFAEPQAAPKHIAKAFEVMGKNKMLIEEPDTGKCYQKIADDYIESINAGKGTMLISGTNKDKDELNRIIRDKLVKAGKVEAGTKFSVIRKTGEDDTVDKNFGKGDTIIFGKNNKDIHVNNGDIAQILDVKADGTIQVKQQESGKVITFNINDYKHVDHAYAITSYKSQGATTDRLIWHASTDSNQNINSFYVAATRCKNEFMTYTNDAKTLQKKVSIEQTKASTMDYTPQRTPPSPTAPTVDPILPVIRKKSLRERLEALKKAIVTILPVDVGKQGTPLNNKESPIMIIQEPKMSKQNQNDNGGFSYTSNFLRTMNMIRNLQKSKEMSLRM